MVFIVTRSGPPVPVRLPRRLTTSDSDAAAKDSKVRLRRW